MIRQSVWRKNLRSLRQFRARSRLSEAVCPAKPDSIPSWPVALRPGAFDRVRHHGIVAPISEGFLAVSTGVSSHDEQARTDPSADSDPLATPDADHRRNARGEG